MRVGTEDKSIKYIKKIKDEIKTPDNPTLVHKALLDLNIFEHEIDLFVELIKLKSNEVFIYFKEFD